MGRFGTEHRPQERIGTGEGTPCAPVCLASLCLWLSDRTARLLLQKWTEDGWLVVADPSRRGRVYELSAIYRHLIGNLTAEDTRE